MSLSSRVVFGIVFSCALAGPAFAVDVANSSFEVDMPHVFAAPGAASWETEGPTGSTGSSSTDAGRFQNLPVDHLDGTQFGFPGVDLRKFDNADGEMLGFINADPESRFNQLLTTPYASGATYQFSIGAGISSAQPPQSNPVQGQGAPSNDKMNMQFYWLNGSTRELIGTPTEIKDDFLPDGVTRRLLNYHLNTFSVSLTVPGNAEYIGKDIGILISTEGNAAGTGGNFAFDSVTVTPEPAAAITLLTAFAGFAGRRRRR